MITRITLLKNQIHVGFQRRSTFTKSFLQIILNISLQLQSSIISFFLILNSIDDFLLNNIRNGLNTNFATLIHQRLLFSISKSALIDNIAKTTALIFHSLSDDSLSSRNYCCINSLTNRGEQVHCIGVILMRLHSLIQHITTMQRFHYSIHISSILRRICKNLFSSERKSIHKSLSDNSSQTSLFKFVMNTFRQNCRIDHRIDHDY